MSQHTPGPWIARPDPNSIMPDGWLTDDWCIGIVGSIDKVAVCSACDARLIAAAPDLLEFAEEVRRTGDTRLASMAIAVIAKAIGEAK